ncbi:MAG: hypothetical protein WBN72_03045 [Nitrososphaeraceae archaeon]
MSVSVAVKKYSIIMYGSHNGFGDGSSGLLGDSRAQIQLINQSNQTVALVFFHDLAMPFPPNDSIDQNIIRMHLPSSMYQSVIDFLRNERTVNINFDPNSNKASLSSPPENIGAG